MERNTFDEKGLLPREKKVDLCGTWRITSLNTFTEKLLKLKLFSKAISLISELINLIKPLTRRKKFTLSPINRSLTSFNSFFQYYIKTSIMSTKSNTNQQYIHLQYFLLPRRSRIDESTVIHTIVSIVLT